MRRRDLLRAIALLVVATVVAACTSTSDTTADATARDPWTEEAQAYGLGPLPNDDVTFQPDVVIVAGAGRSIRSVSDGGLTWRIDGQAEGANELEVGKVMFVTGRSVGRVLALAKEGDDLRVTIGPVTLTEVVRDGTFEMSGIALDRAVEYPAVEPAWETLDPQSDTSQAATARPRADVGMQAASFVVQRPQSQPEARKGVAHPTAWLAASGTATPRCCANGVGVDFNYNDGGTKLFGSVALTFGAPKADFYLDIAAAKVTRAELRIRGGFGVRVNFEAGITGGSRNLAVPFPLEGEWGFPMGQVLGVPLTLTVSQGLTITTAFGTDSGTITGNGSFGLAGTLSYGYANGTFGDHSTKNFERRTSLLNSLSGIPVGVMGLLVEHRIKFSLGFSAYVLKAGIYMDLNVRTGISRGSALGALGYVMCQGVGLGVWTDFGIGFSILQPVVRAINWFLRLVNIKPIPTQGGLQSKPLKIYSGEEVIPEVQVCGHTPGST